MAAFQSPKVLNILTDRITKPPQSTRLRALIHLYTYDHALRSVRSILKRIRVLFYIHSRTCDKPCV